MLANVIVLLLLLFVHPPTTQTQPTQKDKQQVFDIVTIRIGITEYQDLEATYAKYLDFFQELITNFQKHSNQQRLDFKFRLAVGSYEEVKDWYNTSRIDVAIFSAMPMAELLSSTNNNPDFRDQLHDTYMGTLTPNPSNAPFECCPDGDVRHLLYDEIYSNEEKQKIPPAANFYRTVYLVPKGSPIDSLAKLNDHKGKLKFLFVRPFSVSGYLLPAYDLRMGPADIDFTREDYEFTYQHANTLRKLRETNEGKDEKGKYVVAFVQDNAPYCTKTSEPSNPFQRIPVSDELMHVPAESVFVNYHLPDERRNRIKTTLTNVFEVWKESPSSLLRLQTATTHKFDEWFDSFKTIIPAMQTVPKPSSFSHRFTLDQVIKDLELYQDAYKIDQESHNGSSSMRPPRLAVVLSGGGAKCAYEVGAINALEQRLEKERQLEKERNLHHDLDINLVVGTSGGAINAFLVAMGASRPENARQLQAMWGRFNQQDFFQPSFLFNIIFGLCFGFLQALIITVATLLFGRDVVNWNLLGKCLVTLVLVEASLALYLNEFSILSTRASLAILGQVIFVFVAAGVIRLLRRKVKHWWRQAGWLMASVSLIEIILGRFSPNQLPEKLIDYHSVLHLWAIIKLFSIWSVPFPLALGVAMLISGYRKVPTLLDFDVHRASLLRTLTAGLMVIVGLFLLYSLLKEPSPTYPTGIEGKLLTELPNLVTNIKFQTGLFITRDSALAELSRQADLERDLIITASRLPMDARHEDSDAGMTAAAEKTLSANELPNDLYFYYSASNSRSKDSRVLPPPGTQFISLEDNKEKLLDVVIGSGTIYPLFPYRTVERIKVDNRIVPRVDIVDGGFIHNVPVDAAVKWGATHIILIEASPLDEPFAPHSFLDNIVVAFNYLFAQAQHIDADKGTAEVFELRPSSECEKLSKIHRCDKTTNPDMDTFDFDKGVLAKAYKSGNDDMISDSAPLQRRSGQPLFRDPIKIFTGSNSTQ